MKDIRSINFEGKNIIDVFFSRSVPENVRDFLSGAKPIKETYVDKTVSFTEYTPTQKNNVEITISAEDLMEFHKESRHNYIERFKKNKHADIALVDHLIEKNSRKVSVDAQFHVGLLSGDYAKTRIECFGEATFHLYHKTIEVMEEIAKEAEKGTIIRVWYAHNAQDLCGLMSLLDKLKEIDCTIIEFELPDKVYLPSGHVKKGCRYWTQLRPEELCIPISNAKILTPEKKRDLLAKWSALINENTEYRIYENGILKSVDFDYLRKKAIPLFYKNKFSLMQFAGRLLKEEALADLCIIVVLPKFICRLIDVGDLEYLGDRMSFWDNDRWLRSLRKT